ncbi:hypothetical protein HU200_011380 [Digitaria exilis]|uniref:RING-type domain-containing protein n=1 Tax=Digitaria exilis TaxID=1010633 RepID=A0A835FFV5_9POAL|nr:hypothetical protein HU200_011380 [Digitaria exilis]
MLAAGRGAPDDDDIRVCSVILASVVSLMLLCGVLSVVPGPGALAVTKAYVILGVAAFMLVLMLLAWLMAPAIRALTAPPPAPAPVRLARRLCACGLADAAGVAATLPAFPYGASPVAEEPNRRSGVLCAVCLEDVRPGEMVRQLPACGHLFHVGCVDAWLRAHRTCPLCRCELPPRKAAAAARMATTAAAVMPAVAERRAAAVIPATAEGLPLPPV